MLFGPDYVYDSSTTQTFRRHFAGLAEAIARHHPPHGDALAVDIGSNTGVLLAALRDHGFRVVGIDPSASVARRAIERGLPTLIRFFDGEAANELLASHGQAAVITATNVFAHIHDLDAVMRNIDRLLTPDGVFVIEAPYFEELVSELQYDTIYHEHLSYLSVQPLAAFVAKHDLELFDVETVPIHGRSLRLYVGRAGRRPVAPAVQELLDAERASGLHTHDRLAAFAAASRASRDALAARIESLRRERKRVVGVSAPAKGMTLLNFARITRDDLAYVTERSDLKVGLYTPGGHIPVVEDARLEEDQPDYALLLAWNLWREIVANLSAFHDRGGRFIVPGRELREM